MFSEANCTSRRENCLVGKTVGIFGAHSLGPVLASEVVGYGVAGLVDHHLTGSRDLDHRGHPKALLADLAGEHRPLRRQLCNRSLNVVAHQRDLVVLLDLPVLAHMGARGRVDGELRRPRLEDQPTIMDIHIRPPEDVAEEVPCRLRVVSVNQSVDRGDHGRSLTEKGAYELPERRPWRSDVQRASPRLAGTCNHFAPPGVSITWGLDTSFLTSPPKLAEVTNTMRKNTNWAARLALGVATLGTAGILGTVGTGSASATGVPPNVPTRFSPVVGHVYLDDNTAGANTIGAFDRHADGSLSPEPGSPFPAGGAGTGAGLASQGALQLTRDGRYLLAVDAGSNQISVLRVGWDGSLQLLPDGVVSSDGPTPVSIAVHGGLVYVANAGAVDPNFTGFTLSPWGQLQPLPGSTVPLPGSTTALPNGSQPDDVLFNSIGNTLVGNLAGTSQIESFSVGFNGLLTAAPGSPLAAQGLGPFGSEFRPTNPFQLFVSNAHNVGAGTGTVSAFNVAWDGALSSIGASPFADGQTAPCWVEISHDGQFLFTVNTASGDISRYWIAPNGTLTLLGSTPVSGTGGLGAVDARLSPDGRTLYVDESKAGAVGAFDVDGGNLTELPSSPTLLPAGATPAGIVVN